MWSPIIKKISMPKFHMMISVQPVNTVEEKTFFIRKRISLLPLVRKKITVSVLIDSPAEMLFLTSKNYAYQFVEKIKRL